MIQELPLKGQLYTQQVIYQSKKKGEVVLESRIVEVMSVYESNFYTHPSNLWMIRLRNVQYHTEFSIPVHEWPLTIKRSGTWIIYKLKEDE